MNFETLVTIGVFAPLLGAAIAGFFGRRIGNVASQAVTTGLPAAEAFELIWARGKPEPGKSSLCL